MRNLDRTEIIKKLISIYSSCSKEELANEMRFKNVNLHAYEMFVGLLDSEYKREEYERLDRKWEELFIDDSKTRVDFHSWEGFCLFSYSRPNSLNEIKVYIPLDVNHIEDGVYKIFKFLSNNNIKHTSKVRNGEISRDDVVVRLFSEEDARKLIDFVNNDDFFKTNTIEPNPFSIRAGRVGLVSDGMFSYNDFVNNIIYKFFRENEMRRFYEYVIDEEDFIKWFRCYYEEMFIKCNPKKLDELFNLCSASRKLQRVDKSIVYTNMKQMADLLLMNLEGKTVDDYFEYYADITDEELYRHSTELMKNKLESSSVESDMSEDLQRKLSSYDNYLEKLNDYFRRFETYTGDIDAFANEESINGLVLPGEVIGVINFRSLVDASGITFPKKIVGKLYLNGLKSAEGIILPEEVETLYLEGLEDTKGVVFPKKVDELYLGEIKDLSCLKSLGYVQNLYIYGERGSAEDLILPDTIDYLDIMFDSAKGLKVPSNLKGLQLNPYDYSGLNVPEGMEYLGLDYVESFDEINLPVNLDELHLARIFIEELVLPECVRNYGCVSFGDEIDYLKKLKVPEDTNLEFEDENEIEVEYYKVHFKQKIR